MKRINIEIADIAARDNLLLALWQAARGKRNREVVCQWLRNPNFYLRQLQQSLYDSTAPEGVYRRFEIRDPKVRVIHAASFSDRVLHHALMNVAGPILNRSLVSDSYACVNGRGTHAAALRVQHLIRKYPWYVKVDVKGYFPSIDHSILMRLIRRRFKGEQFLALLERIVATNGGEAGRGLPIGSLCSQHFANIYLDGADRLISETLKQKGRVRYMDDIIWWSDSKQQAKESLIEVRRWLKQHRRLTLHDKQIINRSAQGVSFCGCSFSGPVYSFWFHMIFR